MRYQTLAGRFGVIFSLTLGWQILYLCGFAVLGSIVAMSVEGDTADRPSNIGIVEGQPYKWKYLPGTGWSLTTLDDQSVPPKHRLVMQGAPLLSRATEARMRPRELYPVEPWSINRFFLGVTYSEPRYVVQEQVGDHFTIYFAVYSNRTGAPVKYLSAQGESSTIPPPEDRFQPLNGSNSLFNDTGTILTATRAQSILDTASRQDFLLREHLAMITRDGLESINIRTGETGRIITSKDLYTLSSLTIYTHEFGGVGSASSDENSTLLLRSSDTIYTLKNLKVTATTIIPEELRERDFTMFPVSSDLIYYASNQGDPQRGLIPTELLKCDSTGRVIERRAVTQPPPETDLVRRLRYLPIVMFCPAPLMIFSLFGWVDPNTLLSTSEIVRIAWPTILVLLGCGAAAAFAAWKLAPRYSGVPAQFGWLVYVFFFGLPGLAGYLLHFRHKYRPSVAPAAVLGTEVFA